MKILTVIGARPQFIKAAPLSLLIKKNYKSSLNEVVIHTGQHFDKNMSDIFFKDLGMKKPKYSLSLSNLSHGAMTGRMIEQIEDIILKEKPDYLLVYGDTNSTLAGALAAVKLKVKIIHIEAGLRSFNREMPEEINRIIVDSISDVLFCPSKISLANLRSENINAKCYVVGDIMRDCIDLYKERLDKYSLFKQYKLEDNNYFLATIHRAENTDNQTRLKNILKGIKKISEDKLVVLPLHPRTKKKIRSMNLDEYVNKIENLKLLDPMSFFDTHSLLKFSCGLLTDSGGMQKEAFYYGVPCITLRDETEWIETVQEGMNSLVGTNSKEIYKAANNINIPKKYNKNIYGDGNTTKKILDTLISL